MKKTILFLILSGMLMAGDFTVVQNRERIAGTPRLMDQAQFKAGASTVVEVVPHLSANDIWKSILYIRSDSGFSANFYLEFYDPDGNLLDVKFYDSDGLDYYDNHFQRTITGYEIISLEFDSLERGNSFQVFIFTEDNVFYSAEALFNRYNGTQKEASVGVKGAAPGYNFIMNVEERTDLYTEQFNFRAFAISNIEESYCDCEVELYDNGVGGVNLDGYVARNRFSIYERGKAVFYVSDLFDVADLLPKGFGYIIIRCDRVATAMGLTFEENSPVAGSVPIDTVEFNSK
ncbi:MAG: hypothetical protein CSA81_00530 [Acidobacteria bacterium]|nr:MAG: hypothetical protein CSA81_00530 [Acidobacteriota bacterium]